MIKIGIVGSRKRTEEKIITKILLYCLNKYQDEFMVISGGAEGIDKTVKRMCKTINVPFKEYLPDLNNIEDYSDAVNRYYQRNKMIAKNVDILYAFPLNREGGTMNTVKYFLQTHNKNKLKIID